ncbi:MAG: 3-oxoacyl-[acyl-carrier-protein] reductase [Parachlamydiaceae bacterium]|nr:3-oxoacyl-[acyl-carrier-protein] reductase [Parachlamydiaceae bacterium]
MKDLLKGQIAIVTGGTAGIGKAIALRYAEQGAYVAIFGTNIERGAQVVEALKAMSNTGGADFFPVDIGNFSAVDQAIKLVLEKHQRVDVLVNNAGITRDQLLMKMSEADWDEVMNVNVKSCYNTCKSLVRSFLKARKGKIINMSSVIGLTGNAGQVNYAASKAAIIGMTKALAKELASRNIHVNCIAPGFIATSMTEVMDASQKEATLAKIPLGRMGSPDDIANVALFLASSLSDYITGQVFTVDGGMVM